MFEDVFDFIVDMLNAFMSGLNSVSLEIGSYSVGLGYLFLGAIGTLMFAGIFFKNAKG